MMVAEGAVAEKLSQSGVWHIKRGPKRAGAKQPAIEPRRVNIVSQKLCGKQSPSRSLWKEVDEGS